MSMPPEIIGAVSFSSANTSRAPVRARTMLSIDWRRLVPGATICRASMSRSSKNGGRLPTRAPHRRYVHRLPDICDRLQPHTLEADSGVALRDHDPLEATPRQLLDALLALQCIPHLSSEAELAERGHTLPPRAIAPGRHHR